MTETTAGWAKTYALGLWALDSLIIGIAALIGLSASRLSLSSSLSGSSEVEAQAVSYAWVTAGLVIAWALFLEIAGSRNSQVFARGPREYQRVFDATVLMFIVLAAISFLFRAEPSRLFVGLTLALGFLGLLISRTLSRRFIWFMRKRGRMLTTAFLVGSNADRAAVGDALGQSSESGYRIVGDLTIRDQSRSSFAALDRLSAKIQRQALGVDLVIVVSPEFFSPENLARLGERLDVAPLALAVVSTPALAAAAHMRWEAEPWSNLRRARDTHLRFSARMAKRAFDIVFALFMLVLGTPLFILIAILIKIDSSGPILFRQTRTGRYGQEFEILKFRSMRNGAEQELEKFATRNTVSPNSGLFKLSKDPRVTRLGFFLRRWSLDELPQFINVLKGEMSVVGPRPFLPEEAKRNGDGGVRRLMVKPGVTGLWQVSGRSDLSWEDTIICDLSYIENWTPVSDFFILVKTLPAVLSKKGAY